MEVVHMDATQGRARSHGAVVVVGDEHALIARDDAGEPRITEIYRRADPEALYLLRIAREARQCDRLVVMGQGRARLAFEREYVALYRRPDRLVDVPSVPAGEFEVLERLRRLEAAPARA